MSSRTSAGVLASSSDFGSALKTVTISLKSWLPGRHLLGGEDLPQHLPEERDVRRLLRLRARGEEAEDAPLADDLPETSSWRMPTSSMRRAAMDRRLGDRLRDRGAGARRRAGRARAPAARPGPRPGERRAVLAAEEPEPAPGPHGRPGAARRLGERVLA
jgi:hypothetical protein